jgi:hypothetical protein
VPSVVSLLVGRTVRVLRRRLAWRVGRDDDMMAGRRALPQARMSAAVEIEN